MRERIAYSDENKLFIDLDDYDDFVKGLAALSTTDTVIETPPPPPDLSAIFPDLQPFGLLNVPPVPTSGIPTDAKKKSDRKSDRDDPNKRVEDTSYTKLVPLGEFMHCKPTLIGPLNPAKRWRNGKWLSQEDAASNSENDASGANEALCGEFSYWTP
jgi:chromatin modification-related protein VID21